MELVQRLLPTYPQHATRRAEEAREVEQTLLALGVRPCLSAGARQWTDELARADLGQWSDKKDAGSDVVEELIAAFAASGIAALSADKEHRVPLLGLTGWAEQAATNGCSPVPLA
jgi:hypothetical protein